MQLKGNLKKSPTFREFTEFNSPNSQENSLFSSSDRIKERASSEIHSNLVNWWLQLVITTLIISDYNHIHEPTFGYSVNSIHVWDRPCREGAVAIVTMALSDTNQWADIQFTECMVWIAWFEYSVDTLSHQWDQTERTGEKTRERRVHDSAMVYSATVY